MIPASMETSSSGDMPFTVAWVPTGMKAGVSKLPWGVWTLPSLAPVWAHVFINSYLTGYSGIVFLRLFQGLQNNLNPAFSSVPIL
jgi:hypothetical protein